MGHTSARSRFSSRKWFSAALSSARVDQSLIIGPRKSGSALSSRYAKNGSSRGSRPARRRSVWKTWKRRWPVKAGCAALRNRAVTVLPETHYGNNSEKSAATESGAKRKCLRLSEKPHPKRKRLCFVSRKARQTKAQIYCTSIRVAAGPCCASNSRNIRKTDGVEAQHLRHCYHGLANCSWMIGQHCAILPAHRQRGCGTGEMGGWLVCADLRQDPSRC